MVKNFKNEKVALIIKNQLNQIIDALLVIYY